MDAELLMGLIVMAIVGPAIGNYATSVVYRLPFGQTPFEKHPYCGDCNTMLTPRDLFPIWSYVLSRGKCRYCGVQIRPSYTVIEVACGILFMVNFVIYGLSEMFILANAFGVFMVILAGLEYHQARLYPLILTFCFFLAAMIRLLADGTLYPMVQSGFILFFVAIVGWRLSLLLSGARRQHSPEETGYHVPRLAIFAAMLGIALPLKPAIIAAGIVASLYLLQRATFGWKMQSAAAGVGIWLGLLLTY